MKQRRNGQSLAEILLAVALGTIFVIAAVSVIVPALQSNAQAAKIQTASSLAKELMDNVRVWSEGSWNNVLSIGTGTAYSYYLTTSISPFVVATGTESITIASGTAATSSLTAGLVGWWPFDEGTGTVAYDSSGNGTSLAIASSSSIVTWRSGKSGSALGYASNASTSCANLQFGISTSSLPTVIQNLPSGAFSISYWEYVASGGVAMFHLDTPYASSGFAGLWVSQSSIAFNNNSLVNNSLGFAGPSANAWHYFTYVFNVGSTTQQMYIDGALKASGALSGSFGSFSDLNIGVYLPSCVDSSPGYAFDDFRIYNRALSLPEISQLYALSQSTVTYSRHFYLSDVYRDGSGNIVTSGGTYDPSTKLVTVVYGWSGGPVYTMTTYLVRGKNNVVSQGDWSGGPGVGGPATSTSNQFTSSTNIDYASTTGAINVAIPGW